MVPTASYLSYLRDKRKIVDEEGRKTGFANANAAGSGLVVKLQLVDIGGVNAGEICQREFQSVP